MAEPFIAEVRIFPFNFPPRGWAWCNGQLLPISQNTALFALLGTTYGGDGKSTFALPNIQGRAVMHPGRGPGLQTHRPGETGGVESVTLDPAHMPAHSHGLGGGAGVGDNPMPVGNVLARPGSTPTYQTDSTSNLTAMAADALPAAGGGQPHNNMQPYLTLHFNIALQGVFPSRG